MALTIEVDMDVEGVSRWARHVHEDQLPFAISRAINWVALDFQEAQREHMESIFTVRRPRFVLRAVKIKPFARKNRLWARVQIDPPGGRARADILTKFETERFKVPFSGSRIAIPTEHVARTPTGVIRKRHRISEFDLQPVGGQVFSRKSRVAVGERRTVSIQRPGGRGMLFQRQGRGGASELVPLYIYRPRVEIEPELNFVANARRTVRRRWEDAFFRSFSAAVRTARPRAGTRRLRSFVRTRAFSLGARPQRFSRVSSFVDRL